MSIKFDEKVKLDSFEVHYSILQSNIETANADLGNLFKSIEENTEVRTQLIKDIQSLKEELADLVKKRKAVNKEIDERLALVKERELSVEQRETASVNELKNTVLKRDDIISEISGKERELASLNRQVDTMADSTANMMARVQTLDKALKESSQGLVEAHRSIAESDKNIEVLESKYLGRKLEMQAELADLQERIDIASGKLIDTEDYYTRKDAEYARRERDILTVTARLKKLFNEVRPGTALKI